jgi:hypothetical protein
MQMQKLDDHSLEGGFMNRNLSIAMLSVGVLVFALAAGQAEASSCSQAALAGRWSYTYTGTIFLSSPTGTVPLPLASVGYFRQDSAGNVKGSQTRSVAGSSGPEDISGTITLNDNCAATGLIDVSVGNVKQRSAVLALVYNQDTNHFRAIFQSLALPDGTNLPVVITVEGEREHTEE